MRSTVILLGIVVPLCFGFVSAAIAQDEDDDATKTRFGTISYGEDRNDDLIKIAYLDGKEFLRYEGFLLMTEAVLSDGPVDYVLIAQNSGGTACPVEFVILRLEHEKKPVLSEGFGSCSDIAEARVEKGSVIVESVPYLSHPDEVDEKERKAAEMQKIVFTWVNGAGRILEKTMQK